MFKKILKVGATMLIGYYVVKNVKEKMDKIEVIEETIDIDDVVEVEPGIEKYEDVVVEDNNKLSNFKSKITSYFASKKENNVVTKVKSAVDDKKKKAVEDILNTVVVTVKEKMKVNPDLLKFVVLPLGVIFVCNKKDSRMYTTNNSGNVYIVIHNH